MDFRIDKSQHNFNFWCTQYINSLRFIAPTRVHTFLYPIKLASKLPVILLVGPQNRTRLKMPVSNIQYK